MLRNYEAGSQCLNNLKVLFSFPLSIELGCFLCFCHILKLFSTNIIPEKVCICVILMTHEIFRLSSLPPEVAV